MTKWGWTMLRNEASGCVTHCCLHMETLGNMRFFIVKTFFSQTCPWVLDCCVFKRFKCQKVHELAVEVLQDPEERVSNMLLSKNLSGSRYQEVVCYRQKVSIRVQLHGWTWVEMYRSLGTCENFHGADELVWHLWMVAHSRTRCCSSVVPQ